MKTVERFLIYKLTDQQKEILKEKWFVNGCWGGWWFEFKTILNYMFKLIKFFIKKSANVKIKKLKRLWKDIELLCNWLHDIDFSLWGNIKDFHAANMKFICWILGLLHWSTVFIRILVFIVLYIWLNTVGLKFFTFRKKRLQLNDLFINNI